jgi:hypothetical protein
MTIFALSIWSETRFTDCPVATRTETLTGFADRFPADQTFTRATVATSFFAFLAKTAAIRADIGITEIADINVIGIDRSIAVATVDIAPVLDPNERAAVVVGVQHTVDQREEIKKPTLLQSLADWFPGFSFTEQVITNMRMRDIGIGSWRIGIGSNDFIIGHINS